MSLLATALVFGMLAPLELQTQSEAPPPMIAKVLQPINPGSWVTNRDYPKEARRAHIQGTTGFILDVDSAGKVTKCTVTQSSGSDVLDANTCTLLGSRAHFLPAEDAKGNRIPATYRNRFVWVLPK